MIQLIIDNRETELKEYFGKKDNVKFLNLDIGDIQILLNDNVEIIIERKNITDLATSIKDGRYREQKLRLTNNFGKDKILYLIEGTIRIGKIAGLPHTTLIGSMINAMIRDNIKVYRTTNIKETIEFIELLYSKLVKDGDKLLPSNSLKNEESKIDYVSSIKLKKKENLTEENCFLLQLSQIPGVSLNIAKEIKKNYNSMFELCQKYNEQSTLKEKEILLKDISFEIANDKTRKIGKVVSERVFNYLSNSETKLENNEITM